MFGRDYSKFSESDFRDDVDRQTWNCNNLDDHNFLMNDFLWRLDGCAERHAPIKKLKTKEVKLKLNPWITPEINKLMKIRDRFIC